MATDLPDLAIVGGRVIDPESGTDAIRTVVVDRGTITAVTSDRPAARTTIDAGGRIVAPGFIDLHSHAQTIASLRLQAFDGVTTALELEGGSSPVDAAYAEAAREGRPVHYGFSASWAAIRMQLLDGAPPTVGPQAFFHHFGGDRWQQPATARELDEIVDRLEGELGRGALGIGILVGYAPETTREEYLRIARLAASRSAPTFTHARYKNQVEPRTAVEGITEIVAAAAGTGAHMHVCHVNSTSLRAIDEVATAVEAARRDGLRVTTEAYPYGAGMTAIGAPFLDPANLPRLGIEPRNIAVIRTGERPATEERLRQLRAEDPGASVIIHYLEDTSADDQAVLRRALLLEDTAVASDAIAYTGADGELLTSTWPLPPDAISHPRSAGTFTRFWKTMVRDSGLLSVTEAVRRCTLVPAQILADVAPAMKRKGRIQAGADADLVVFDPDTLADRATYARPHQSSTGVEHLLVGGTPLIRDGELDPTVLPGQPIRGAAG